MIEGFAREIVNRIQTARRDLDLDVTDRIKVAWSSNDPRIASAFEAHADLITDEVLATGIRRTELDEKADLAGVSFGLLVEKSGD